MSRSRSRSTRRIKPLRSKPWAFLAYIGGDNDLSDYGLRDLEELCREGAAPSLHVGVEIDTHGEHEGSVRYQITQPDETGESFRMVVERLRERDSGSPKTLEDFLRWGCGRFTADEYIIVIGGHGTGFRRRSRNVGFDDFGSSLDMPDIRKVLQRCGFKGGSPLSILAFDACLMNMLEIVHHFRGHVRYIVGSQQTEPADGWPYDRVLAGIKAVPKGKGGARRIARRLVQEYRDFYEDVLVQNITQSSIELSKTEAAVQALSGLGNTLRREIGAIYRELREVRGRVQSFEMSDYVDLVHFAEELANHALNRSNQVGVRPNRGFWERVMDDSEKVIETTNDAIVSFESRGPKLGNANGLSVWFPPYESLYYNNRARYIELDCNGRQRTKGWLNFLDAYFATRQELAMARRAGQDS